MKQLLTTLAASAALLLGVLNYLEQPSRAPLPFEPLAEGTEDNPHARADFQLMRFADPSTGKIPDGIREKELAYAATLPAYNTFLNGRTSSFWVQRGPFHVGGKTRALAMDVSNENILLAGNTSGGIWKSTDGGSQWLRTNQKVNASCIAQDRRTGKTATWYCGTGELYTGSNGNFFIGNGMYKSTDNGDSWSLLSSFSSSNPQFDRVTDIVWNVATDPSDTLDEVYAATYGAIYRSANGGASWSAVRGSSTGSAFSVYTDIAVSSTGVVYATLSSETGHKGIWRSTDGVAWTNITPANWPSTYKRIVIGISPSDENQVYFLAETPNSGLAITNFLGTTEWVSFWKYNYLSGDGSGAGGTWEDRSNNLPASGTPTDRFYSQGSYDLVLKVKPNNPNIVFIGGTNLYRSDDAFATGSQITRIGGYGIASGPPGYAEYPNHHPDQHGLVFYPSNPDKMLSACDGGVYLTTDNTSSNLSWTPLNNGYVTTQFYTTAIDHGTPNSTVVVAGAQDNGTWFTNSLSPTATWTHPNGGDGSFCAIADGGGTYYFSIQNGKINKATVDGSGNKTSFRRIDPIGARDYLFINPFVLDPNNNNLMYLAGGRHIWRNNDLSQIPLSNAYDSISTNWDKLQDSATSVISALGISRIPANRLYFGTNTGQIHRMDNVNTGNPVKTNIRPSIFPGTGYISCIAVDPTNADRIIAVFSNYNTEGLYFSGNGGASWSRITGNLKSTNGPACLWASILPVGNDTAYLVGTSTGLYATNRLKGNSTLWVQQGASSIGNAVVTMIDTRPSDGLAVVATHGSGIFSSNITSISDIVTSAFGKDDMSGQLSVTNYPNPLREQTTIEFSLPTPETVSLKIYDINGRELDQLIDATLPAGRHTYTYHNRSLSPGIYFCSLKAGSSRQTRRIAVVK